MIDHIVTFLEGEWALIVAQVALLFPLTDTAARNDLDSPVALEISVGMVRSRRLR
jgi:hypothetical protein